MRRFWAVDGNRKWTVFPFSLSCHHHLYTAKSLSSIRDDWVENLGDNTVLACKMVISGCRPRLKNVPCLNSLIVALRRFCTDLAAFGPIFSSRSVKVWVWVKLQHLAKLPDTLEVSFAQKSFKLIRGGRPHTGKVWPQHWELCALLFSNSVWDL